MTPLRRLNDGQPILHRSTHEGVGENVNGPSLVRVPDWIPPERRAHPTAQYYLYFANHGGDHIRMAWAEKMTGPYTVWQPGRGVLELPIATRRLTVHSHVASPDIQFDNERRRILMYFHGCVAWPGVEGTPQCTMVAASDDGLDFNGAVSDALLGQFYFRALHYGGQLYSISNFGVLYRARDIDAPFDHPDDVAGCLWEEGHALDWGDGEPYPRHSAFWVTGDTLHWFFTRIGDTPERVQYATVDLSALWREWTPTEPQDMLVSELDWEGAGLPDVPSARGPATGVRQLRDPAVFIDDDGRHYLLYSGRGEEGIGLCAFDDVWLEGRRADRAASGKPLRDERP
ncbi:hypothetical protein HQ560_08605 [bacterium]|nr:hypothetical protein [bacterium]